MQYQRVLIVGGTGFIGRYVVKRLAARGTVIAVVSRNADAAGFLRPLGDVGQIALINAGLGNERRLRALLEEGMDAVICCAGVLYSRGRQTFAEVHHEGPARLARLATASGVKRFVHVSALGADAASPSAYGRSKAAGEAAVRAAFPEAVIFRPSIVFGPEDDFFNRFASLARYSPMLPLIGGGLTRFQPVYVGDVADAVAAALDRHDSAGRIFELGGPLVYSFKELMELLLREIDRRRALVSLPVPLAQLMAFFLEWLPSPPLTRDQVRLLQKDNVVEPGVPDLGSLGVTPTSLELVLPTYLDRFRRGGRFGLARAAPAGPLNE
jgi:NADH dehydrogenase